MTTVTTVANCDGGVAPERPPRLVPELFGAAMLEHREPPKLFERVSQPTPRQLPRRRLVFSLLGAGLLVALGACGKGRKQRDQKASFWLL